MSTPMWVRPENFNPSFHPDWNPPYRMRIAEGARAFRAYDKLRERPGHGRRVYRWMPRAERWEWAVASRVRVGDIWTDFVLMEENELEANDLQRPDERDLETAAALRRHGEEQ